MDAPDRDVLVVLSHRPVPRDRVVVVGVDERAVDVEDRCGSAHRCHFLHRPIPNHSQAKSAATHTTTTIVVVVWKSTSVTRRTAPIIATARATIPHTNWRVP